MSLDAAEMCDFNNYDEQAFFEQVGRHDISEILG